MAKSRIIEVKRDGTDFENQRNPGGGFLRPFRITLENGVIANVYASVDHLVTHEDGNEYPKNFQPDTEIEYILTERPGKYPKIKINDFVKERAIKKNMGSYDIKSPADQNKIIRSVCLAVAISLKKSVLPTLDIFLIADELKKKIDKTTLGADGKRVNAIQAQTAIKMCAEYFKEFPEMYGSPSDENLSRMFSNFYAYILSQDTDVPISEKSKIKTGK